jgi:2-keto-4-pentenoate hydratase/2-oxohepta-3-ene-1,7-dioic acid hydratase in catechol pathway
MRLVTFEDEAGCRVGVLDAGAVVDLARAEQGANMLSFVRGGDSAIDGARSILASGDHRRPVSEVRLRAPIPQPARNIFCVGKNYHAHAAEFHRSGFDATASSAVPEAPVVFTKAPSAVIGPGETIPAYLDPTASVDYEGELAVVIGRGGRGIRPEDAFAHVYGYTIVNDVTARTLQQRHKQWFIGKSLDGFCPMGPTLLTADEVPDVSQLRLVTRVNGEPRQDAVVADLIFDIPTLIATLSAGITLEPGDIIATGTPEGVGIGFEPPRFLQANDQVAITIEPIGTLENPVL